MSSTIPCSSSAGRRRSSASDGGASISLTPMAWAPLRLSTTPNSIRCPDFSSATPAGSAPLGRNTSPPSSLVTNPNPFAASYHFTRPVGTADLNFTQWKQPLTARLLSRGLGPNCYLSHQCGQGRQIGQHVRGAGRPQLVRRTRTGRDTDARPPGGPCGDHVSHVVTDVPAHPVLHQRGRLALGVQVAGQLVDGQAEVFQVQAGEPTDLG